MRLFRPVILMLLGTVKRLRDQLPVGNTIAAQLVGDDLPGLAAMTSQ